MTPIQSNVDAWVNQTNVDQNYGDNAKLVLSDQSGNQKFAYIFVARPFDYGSKIETALLRVHVAGSDWSTATQVHCRRVTGAWKENRVTWTNKPADNAPSDVYTSVSGLADTDVVEINVAAMMQAVSDDPTAEYHGFRLHITTAPDRKLYSSNTPDSELWPELEIVWSENPDPPTGLEPNGGAAVTSSKPTVDWDFNDVSEGGTQLESRVQIDTTDDFASPVYDSAQIGNVDSSWNTGTGPAWAGMSAATTYYWRVMVWDDSGLPSEWSDTAEMTYAAPGTLTLNNPAASPNDYVEETTPPIAWTFTGSSPQEVVRVYLEEMSPKGRWEEIWKMHKTVTTDAQVTVPKHLIHSLTVAGQQALYRVTVDVWDEANRQGTLDNPAYRRVQRTFTYQRATAGNPSAPASLTATAQGSFVLLRWTSATMPDYWCIKVDGREEMQRIVANDLFVSGPGNYELLWCRAHGGVAHTYEVEAVKWLGSPLKNRHSKANPTATATTVPYGIVLADDETDIANPAYVVMRGLDGPGLAIGQTGETFRLHGARKPVRIVDSTGGYEGGISGLLMSNEDRDTFESLVGTQPGTELRLMIADVNVPVVLGDITLTPQSDTDTRWQVEAEVFQVGEFTIDLGSP